MLRVKVYSYQMMRSKYERFKVIFYGLPNVTVGEHEDSLKNSKLYPSRPFKCLQMVFLFIFWYLTFL